MASNMATIALVLLSALTANAVNLRSLPDIEPVHSVAGKAAVKATFPACPQGGWTYNTENSHCYRKWPKMSIPATTAPGGQTLALQYDHATKACKHFGAYIATPNTLAENNFLKTFFNPLEPFFLGFDQSGMAANEAYWEDHSKENAIQWKTIASATNADARITPVPATGVAPTVTQLAAVKPVLKMVTGDATWEFTAKTEDLPFVCELVYCRSGCNPMEKAPGTLDSADTIVYPPVR